MPPDSLESLFAPLTPEQREQVLALPRAQRLPLLATLRREQEATVLHHVALLSRLPVAEGFAVAPEATKLIPLRLLHEYQCLPLAQPAPAQTATGEGELPPVPPPETPPEPLPLVTVWPPEGGMDEWVYATCGRPPQWHLGLPRLVSNTLTQNFGVGAGSLSESEAATDPTAGRDGDEPEDEDAALIRFVNEVIVKAIEDRATDIHFEPQKESVAIRYRIDGELVPIRVPDNLVRFQGAIISRLKIMAKLNISEKRRPQDGRIGFKRGDSDLDIRISTMPTLYGESVSLRLLNQKNQILTMEELGLLPEDRRVIERTLQIPHGILLVTGPTGSGKSTSLTAFLREINQPGMRLITIEDPIEYEVPGVNQAQVRPEIGFTFAAALRHVLRQDPDVIMVGEIRDRETAEIAIRAAQTGHLVLSTLHTNDAPGALTRLTDMGIEPFLIASAVEMIISQRLVRRLCPHCKRPASHLPGYLENCLLSLGITPTPQDLGVTTYVPVGCDHCRRLGYRGRVGIFEILRMSPEIHSLVVERQPSHVIRTTALEQGMGSLQESGWKQVRLGVTSLDEIMLYAKQSSEEG